jgi:hypothetical protein
VLRGGRIWIWRRSGRIEGFYITSAWGARDTSEHGTGGIPFLSGPDSDEEDGNYITGVALRYYGRYVGIWGLFSRFSPFLLCLHSALWHGVVNIGRRLLENSSF